MKMADKIGRADKGTADDKNKWIFEKLIFMEDGTTPRCLHCGKAMRNYIAAEGEFKGQIQKHSWVCDCPEFPKNIVLSVG